MVDIIFIIIFFISIILLVLQILSVPSNLSPLPSSHICPPALIIAVASSPIPLAFYLPPDYPILPVIFKIPDQKKKKKGKSQSTCVGTSIQTDPSLLHYGISILPYCIKDFSKSLFHLLFSRLLARCPQSPTLQVPAALTTFHCTDMPLYHKLLYILPSAQTIHPATLYL